MAVVTTTPAIAASAGGSSAVRSSNNKYIQYKIDGCKLVIDHFDPDMATVKQKQQYSECVEFIYSEGTKDTMAVEFIWVAIILVAIAAFTCFIVHDYQAHKELIDKSRKRVEPK